MRIGLDATRIRMPTGERTYVREIISNVIQLFPDDEFFVVVPDHIRSFDFANVEQIVYRDVDGLAARLVHAVKIGRIVRKYNLHIYHNLTNYAAFGATCPVVTTVMDLATLKHPEARGNRLHSWIYRHVFPRLLKRSQRLIAISECTRDDVERFYGLGEQVSVIPNGIDHERFNTNERVDPSLLDRFNLPPNYLLFVGYLTPKKNLDIVLRAMHQLRCEGVDTQLVLVGKRGYGSESFFALAEQLRLTDRLVETGFVSDEELVALYRQAGLFVFPSIYEGFGLPVIEAMACGTPVLASNAGPLPEVVNDPTCCCDPHDETQWAGRIRSAISDPSVRERGLRQGLANAQRFSWERAALRLRRVYEEVVEQSCR